MTKIVTILAVIVVGVAVLSAAFFSLNNYIYNEKQEPNPVPEQVVEDGETPIAESMVSRYENTELGFAFEYPRGYLVLEPVVTGEAAPVKTVVLVHPDDVEAVQNPPEGGEGPATITVTVFENTEKKFPRAWANDNVAYSNLALINGEESDVVVGGANAIRYQADGLYTSDNIVVAHGKHVYMFSGMFQDVASELRRDFSPLVASIEFIQSPGQE